MTGPDLTRNLANLADEVRGLRTAANTLAGRTDSAERAIRLVAAVAALGLILTFVTGVLYLRQKDTSQRLEMSIATQERTRAQVLCPLYQLFLDSYHPERQPTARRAEYEKAFVTIRQGAQTLGCFTKR